MQVKKVYLLDSKKRRCSKCQYEFTPHSLPLRLTRDQWIDIKWFLLELNSQNISIRAYLKRQYSDDQRHRNENHNRMGCPLIRNISNLLVLLEGKKEMKVSGVVQDDPPSSSDGRPRHCGSVGNSCH